MLFHVLHLQMTRLAAKFAAALKRFPVRHPLHQTDFSESYNKSGIRYRHAGRIKFPVPPSGWYHPPAACQRLPYVPQKLSSVFCFFYAAGFLFVVETHSNSTASIVAYFPDLCNLFLQACTAHAFCINTYGAANVSHLLRSVQGGTSNRVVLLRGILHPFFFCKTPVVHRSCKPIPVFPVVCSSSMFQPCCPFESQIQLLPTTSACPSPFLPVRQPFSAVHIWKNRHPFCGLLLTHEKSLHIGNNPAPGNVAGLFYFLEIWKNVQF